MDNNNNNYNQNPNNNYPYVPGPVPGKGKATAALVLGIVSVVLCWFGYTAILTIVLSIVGIVLGIGAKKEMQLAGNFSAKGMATAGLVLSIIALALSAIVFISCTICLAAAGTAGYFGY